MVLVLAAVFVLFFRVPAGGSNGKISRGSWIRLLAAIVVFSTIRILQLCCGLHASVPQIWAVEAVMEGAGTFELLVAWFDVSPSTMDPGYFSESMDKLDALYFPPRTHVSIGSGELIATSKTSRGLVSILMISARRVLAITAQAAFLTARQAMNPRT